MLSILLPAYFIAYIKICSNIFIYTNLQKNLQQAKKNEIIMMFSKPFILSKIFKYVSFVFVPTFDHIPENFPNSEYYSNYSFKMKIKKNIIVQTAYFNWYLEFGYILWIWSDDMVSVCVCSLKYFDYCILSSISNNCLSDRLFYLFWDSKDLSSSMIYLLNFGVWALFFRSSFFIRSKFWSYLECSHQISVEWKVSINISIFIEFICKIWTVKRN